MKSISAALKAHLASDVLSVATCCRLQRADGTVVFLTDHNQDIDISAWTGGDAQFNGLYLSGLGYQKTTVESTESLGVDNVEMHGVLASPSINEADLKAGLWDHAQIELFLVNYKDLTQLRLSQRKGWLGEITLDERGAYKAELRGLMQAYSRTIGELTQAGCRANLFDSRCKVVASGSSGFSVTGTITGFSADQLTLQDTTRTEPGPTGGQAITAIEKTGSAGVSANMTRISVASVADYDVATSVILSEIVGSTAYWAQLNGAYRPRNVDTSHNKFEIDYDSSAFTGSYTGSSGNAAQLGDNSGFFDFGVITMTSGLNIGLSQEVRAYAPGVLILELPFPYDLSIGDAYSMIAGCDKSLDTCKLKFNNVVNFRGEPYLPGLDRIVQVGKQ